MIMPIKPFRPANMPEVKQAEMFMPDLLAAVQRIQDAWSPSQVNDALRSLRYWADRIDEAVNRKDKN